MVKILVLEDDLDFAALLVDSLTEEGHVVEAFATAIDALDAVKQRSFDVVITDVFIKVDGEHAGEGGINLVSQVKQVLLQEIPVIAISGSFSPNEVAPIQTTLKTVGADAVLAKPFHPEDLLNLIFKLTDKS